MATVNIEKRNTKSGIRFRARIRIRSKLFEKGYYEENKTFSTREKARSWANKRATEIDEIGIPKDKDKFSLLREKSLSTLIRMYLDHYNNELGRSKYYALRAISERDIAINIVSSLTKEDIIDYAKDRRAEGVSAYTVYQDILYIKSVVNVSTDKEFRITGNIDFITDAFKHFKDDIKNNTPKHKRLVEFSANERTILPTSADLKLLREALRERENHTSAKIPYLQILDFAIASCMRISEICRVKWENFDEDQKTLLIEDRKHPTHKIGNHVLVPLVNGALEIVVARKKQYLASCKENGFKINIKDKIFPFDPRSVTAGWQRCRKKLIEDGHNVSSIRFHDLRAYGATLLMNKDWSLAKVSKVTGHRDINVLNNIYNRLDVVKIAEEDYQERNQQK